MHGVRPTPPSPGTFPSNLSNLYFASRCLLQHFEFSRCCAHLPSRGRQSQTELRELGKIIKRLFGSDPGQETPAIFSVASVWAVCENKQRLEATAARRHYRPPDILGTDANTAREHRKRRRRDQFARAGVISDQAGPRMSFESPRFPEPPDEGGGLGDSAADDDDDPLASSECGDDVGPGCFPRPPEFSVPPPPLPPNLCSSVVGGRRGVGSSSSSSSGANAVAPDELQFCEVRPIGAELTTPSAFPSLPVIAVCSSVVLVAVLVASFLLWNAEARITPRAVIKAGNQAALRDASRRGGEGRTKVSNSGEEIIIRGYNKNAERRRLLQESVVATRQAASNRKLAQMAREQFWFLIELRLRGGYEAGQEGSGEQRMGTGS
ncbi:hypothetical protein HPB48_021585 [Haemaphysalis longicornis]|uniref:Transmembrane protein n=1 Tax=Haemaphysalis longicornis TaxID=44386 RepID=A0A9J6GZT9_HAELO|nr:hypothetical protein HPB48_021585 [Haemaphysalis longicornis]